MEQHLTHLKLTSSTTGTEGSPSSGHLRFSHNFLIPRFLLHCIALLPLYFTSFPLVLGKSFSSYIFLLPTSLLLASLKLSCIQMGCRASFFSCLL